MSSIDTLTWVNGDAITAEKLQAMVQELRQLRVDIPSVKIQDQRNDQVIANIGNRLKFVAGTTVVQPDPTSQIVRSDVKFHANSFSPGNAPIVIASLSTVDRVRAFCTVTGWRGSTESPDHNGFSVWVAHQILPPNAEGATQVLTISKPQLVFWLAIGY